MRVYGAVAAFCPSYALFQGQAAIIYFERGGLAARTRWHEIHTRKATWSRLGLFLRDPDQR